MSSTISYQTALIYAMAVAALADRKLMDSELINISEIVHILPIFKDFDRKNLARTVGDCAEILDQEDGLAAVVGLIKEALPEKLHETAYALACDIVSVDGIAEQEELVWLKILRAELNISRLHAAAIERGSRARYMRPPKEENLNL